jgi:hypothetical protein
MNSSLNGEVFDPRRRQRGFFPLISVSKPALGAHPHSCPTGTGGPFPGVKHGRNVTLTTHSHLCRCREWVGTTLPSHLRLHRCVVGLLYLLMVRCGVLFEVRAEFLNNIYTSFGFKGVTISFRLPDCWLVASMHPEGPATGHLDTGFLGFPLSLNKCWDGSQIPSCYCMLLMQPSLNKFIKITPCCRDTKLVNFQIISTLSN